MRLLKEPLLHFLVLGAILFADHAALALSEEAGPTAQVIRITAADADWLKEMWTRSEGCRRDRVSTSYPEATTGDGRT